MKAFQLPRSVICLQFSKLHKLPADVDVFSIGWCSPQRTADLMTRLQSKCPKGKYTHTHIHTHTPTQMHTKRKTFGQWRDVLVPQRQRPLALKSLTCHASQL